MPRISIEKKIAITKNISEIKTITYDLPEKILYNDKVLSYDSYHKEYTDHNKESISALDYLKMELF